MTNYIFKVKDIEELNELKKLSEELCMTFIPGYAEEKDTVEMSFSHDRKHVEIQPSYDTKYFKKVTSELKAGDFKFLVSHFEGRKEELVLEGEKYILHIYCENDRYSLMKEVLELERRIIEAEK